jgi:hypothetical protein
MQPRWRLLAVVLPVATAVLNSAPVVEPRHSSLRFFSRFARAPLPIYVSLYCSDCVTSTQLCVLYGAAAWGCSARRYIHTMVERKRFGKHKTDAVFANVISGTR